MRRHIPTILCVLVLASGSIAQAPADTPDAPSKEDVMRFLDLMQVKSRMIQMMDGMKNGMKTGAEAGLKQQLPNATPEQIAKADMLADTVFHDFPIDEMFDAMIPIYQKHLTKADLDAVIAFYASPAGQRLLKEQPAMMTEAMQAGQNIMLKKIPDLTQRLNTEVAALAKQEADRNAPAPATK
jgi:hypothetical protein